MPDKAGILTQVTTEFSLNSEQAAQFRNLVKERERAAIANIGAIYEAAVNISREVCPEEGFAFRRAKAQNINFETLFGKASPVVRVAMKRYLELLSIQYWKEEKLA